jgi:hypothetical protein
VGTLSEELFGFPTPAIIPESFSSVVVAPPGFGIGYLLREQGSTSLFERVIEKFADSKMPVQFMALLCEGAGTATSSLDRVFASSICQLETKAKRPPARSNHE